ncbi:ER degradation-enhancing alpha-mannosidase-like protein 2 [Entophlyctis luteolus]|nr:ER degradation-enhancing alpha-mannosidase-like protein 2 [Entophlyctis luteolus]
MFLHGLTAYMDLAYPKDELMPISGDGMDTLGNFSLTLIDALDTVLIMGDADIFSALIPLIPESLIANVTVSVFETNIRILGGLLSAHIMAATHPTIAEAYDHGLLARAEEVGRGLLRAFDTPTGLPYGSVNLVTGVQDGESLIVCTACAGTFALEFTWLSLLTEDPSYELAARKAMRALWKYKSDLDLFGNHINIETGEWVFGKECTIGGLVDSFYEYLLKASIAFSDEAEYGELFAQAYRAIKIWMKKGDWHVDVHIETGKVMYPYFHSLGAFWPGVKILAGDVEEGMRELNAMSETYRLVAFLPEALNLQESTGFIEGRTSYPLRPEFVESLWVAYRATKNPTILRAAFEMVDRLNNHTRTEHGFANVADVRTLALEDKMESFFLAETLKYLYLIFDVDNEYNSGNYVFNTEAHPFPVWGYHHTLYHPYEEESRGANVPIYQGQIQYSAYKGDEEDAVFSGFHRGICLKSDWERGRYVDVDLWMGKHQMPRQCPATHQQRAEKDSGATDASKTPEGSDGRRRRRKTAADVV